jgi:hypothetical protein
MNTEKETKKKVSIGQIYGSTIFEQIGNEYAIYQEMANATWETTTKRTHENFIPMPRTPLTHPTKAQEYESPKQLWKDVKGYIYAHLDLLNPLGYDILTAFVFASWIPELFDYTSYLGFYGRESVGKTRALELLHELCFRAWLTTGITTATLFRLVERFQPTLLLDESEFLKTKDKQELIGLLNAGQRRGVFIPRMKGEQSQDVEFFNVYCPKAIAGTEQLKRTTTSRMITFTMTRNIRKVPRRIDKKQGLRLRNQLLMWRFKTIAKLKDSLTFKEKVSSTFELKATTEYKELEPLSGRTYELFYPLYYSAPTDKKNILEFAMELEQIKLAQEKTALTSLIFEAILNLKHQAKHGTLLIKQIRQYINSDEEPQNWIPTKTITKKCNQMGFEKTRTNRGIAIILNNQIIERLRKDLRYSTDLINFSDASAENEAKRGRARDWLSNERV